MKISRVVQLKNTPFTHQEGFEFLSNMRYYKLWYGGVLFNASENLYQFSKLPEEMRKEWIERFAKMNPFTARKMTRKLPIRKDWENVKLKVMFDVLKLKFYQHSYLIEKLIRIEGMIVEYNYWRDIYWGYDYNLKKGENNLGKLFMLFRDAFRENRYPDFKDFEKYKNLKVP